MSYHLSLFLQQSYLDAWQSYSESLTRDVRRWDYVILTASGETQANAYREQIRHRLEKKRLWPETHYAVLPDPGGKRVGSGGATLNAIRYVKEHSGGLAGKRILVIHSGGNSKRIPQYSACGKLFSPVPRELPDGRRSTLFDEMMIGYSGVALRIPEGMLVCSGDVLMLFNPLQIDFYGSGAAALSIKAKPETGKNHGVYLKDAQGYVGRFLHKQSVAALTRLGAVDAWGNVDIDTGAVILGSQILGDLYRLIDSDEKFDAYVNERVQLSFYADFLYPLASRSTLSQFYRQGSEAPDVLALKKCRTALWETLHQYRMQRICFSPASFFHTGTTGELLQLMQEHVEGYGYLGWRRNVCTNNRDDAFAASNSYISRAASVGDGSFIEDSCIHRGTAIGKGCVISGVTLDGQTVPDSTVLHGLKLQDGRFVVRIYGAHDDPKQNRLFERNLDEPLWTAKLYQPESTIEGAVNAALDAFRQGFVPTGGERLSLLETFERADITAILPWQDKLSDKVKVELLLDAVDERSDLDKSIQALTLPLSKYAEEMLLHEAEKLNEGELKAFGRKTRIYYALSRLTSGLEREKYAGLCYATIRNAVLPGMLEWLRGDTAARIARDEMIVELPVRVNWGGGWSDTPPYCMENGGTVLNAAILLNGKRPIRVVIKRIDEPKIIIASDDHRMYGEFTDVSELHTIGDPYDPFALHKAALLVCGIVPYQRPEVTMEQITQRLGGGIYLSTQVLNIPRGSGLGTSSILASACVKGLCAFVGKELSDSELFRRVLSMEQIMSTGGGWQDQVGGLIPGIKMVISDPGIRQEIRCIPVSLSPETVRELNERFCLVYTGQRRMARNLLREVVDRYIGGNPDANAVLYDIQRTAILMRFELQKGNVDGFARLLSAHWELSKRLDAGSTNTCIDQIFLSIEDMIDGKMICGAGGGGFLQVVLKKGVTKEQLRGRLIEVFQDSGVDVRDCTLV